MYIHDALLERQMGMIFHKHKMVPGISPSLHVDDKKYEFIKRAVSAFNYWCRINYVRWEQLVYENHNGRRFYSRGGMDEKRSRALSGVFVNFLKREYKGLSIPRRPSRRFIRIVVENKCIKDIEVDEFYQDYGCYKELAYLLTSDEIKSYVYQKRIIPELDSIISKIK
jgi:hypothetical protein